MSEARSGQTSVRSLLAKFENQSQNSSTSPPSRGRSPTGSNRTGSERPLSKVRASFIAVERAVPPGSNGGPHQIWGLRKASDVANPQEKPKVEGLGSPIEKSAALSPPNSTDKPVLEREPTLSPPSSVAGLKDTPETKTESKTQDNNTANEDASDVGEIPRSSFSEESPAQKDTTSDSTQEKETAARESKVGKKLNEPAVPKKQTTSTAATKATVSSRPARITTGKDASKSTAKRSPTHGPKSPPLPQTPRTPATPGHRQPSTTTNTPVAKKETERPSRVLAKRPSDVRASSQPAGGKTTAKARSQTLTLAKEDNGSKASARAPPSIPRAKAKSPTRPVRLPASMIAPTASSAAKLKTDTQTSRPASRTGGNAANNTQKAPTKGPAASLKQTSTIRKAASHASLAPAANIADRPRSRVSNVGSRAPDESFLARMMRPTASSAGKMHEKVEIKSPPRPIAANKSATKPAQQRKVSGRQQQKSPQSQHPKPPSRPPSAETAISNTEGDVILPANEQKPDVPPKPDTLPATKEEGEEPALEQTEKKEEEKAPEDIPLPPETETEL
ncbi:hypothetical protein VTO42DRAFT_5718 [Malbranchea cinnamomea]